MSNVCYFSSKWLTVWIMLAHVADGRRTWGGVPNLHICAYSSIPAILMRVKWGGIPLSFLAGSFHNICSNPAAGWSSGTPGWTFTPMFQWQAPKSHVTCSYREVKALLPVECKRGPNDIATLHWHDWIFKKNFLNQARIFILQSFYMQSSSASRALCC